MKKKTIESTSEGKAYLRAKYERELPIGMRVHRVIGPSKREKHECEGCKNYSASKDVVIKLLNDLERMAIEEISTIDTKNSTGTMANKINELTEITNKLIQICSIMASWL
jgi:hypothetical protein